MNNTYVRIYIHIYLAVYRLSFLPNDEVRQYFLYIDRTTINRMKTGRLLREDITRQKKFTTP
jgi:hypothetical protein